MARPLSVSLPTFELAVPCFGKIIRVSGVRGSMGALLTEPRDMDHELWQSRAAIWDTIPPLPVAT
eukprot:4401785-Alexandrium_andersonii.AAC.1